MLAENMQQDISDESILKGSNAANDILHLNSKIVLHTKLAVALFRGSWKTKKPGLLQFATVISDIWKASRNDDPYADWFLMKIYQAIFDARQQISSLEKETKLCFDKLRGIEVVAYQNDNPQRFPLNFTTPFGFMGAYLIADIDYIQRQLLTLKHMGIHHDQDILSTQALIKPLLKIFALTLTWKNYGVTRNDIKENNNKAEQAIKRFGELPLAILDKEIDFAFKPKLTKKGEAQ